VKFVDAHFHLDLYKDSTTVLSACEENGIYTIAVTNAPSVFSHTQQLVAQTKHVRAALGLHPELVASHSHELPDLLRLMEQTRYIGEVGLDYVTSDTAIRRKQREVFDAILQRAGEFGDRILTVHSRRAAKDVIDCVGNSFPGTVILHWFSGSRRELHAALEANCYFSVNSAMIRSEKGKALIREIPRNRLLTETDGPFIEVDGRHALPTDVRNTINSIASLWTLDPTETAAMVLSNFRTIIESRTAHEKPLE
jgi:TatD DNase family protein